MEYFAFGKTFVEEHSNNERTPYLFNGKELDEETGLYYYGARYYDARTSEWLAVDPVADEFLGGARTTILLKTHLDLMILREESRIRQLFG